jgi:hypothetical protein
MAALPPIDFAPEDWPDPQADGSTSLTPELAARFLALLITLTDYLEQQYARCAETAP